MFKKRLNHISNLIILACLLISTTIAIPACDKIEQATSSVKEKASEVMAPPPTPSPTQKTPTSATTSPPYTAEIIYIPSWRDYVQTGVLFSNNTGDFIKLSCTVREHAPDGTYLAEITVTSDFILPQKHFVAWLSSDTITGLTVSNLQVVNVPTMPHFILATMNNITITTTDTGTNLSYSRVSNGEAIPTLHGKLLNIGTETFGETGTGQENWFTPTFIRVQILKRTANGGLTLVADLDTQHVNLAHFPQNPKGMNYINPIPPPNESINLTTLLWDNITIIDSAKGIIDGEINILAQKLR